MVCSLNTHYVYYILCRNEINSKLTVKNTAQEPNRYNNLQGVRNPNFVMLEIKTEQKSDSLSCSTNNTIKMVDISHKVNEPLYEITQIVSDEKSNSKDDVKMEVNPSYNVSNVTKVNDNVHKVEGSSITQLNTKSNQIK